MAILLGAFLMHGLTPGPEMLTKHLDLTYTIIWSLTLAHVIGAVICLSCSRWLAMVSRIRPEILLPIIVALVFVAAFEGSHDWGDLFSLLFFGVIGWIMKRLGWPRPPMVLGLVVGAIFERYLFISAELASVIGDHRYDDRWTDYSAGGDRRRPREDAASSSSASRRSTPPASPSRRALNKELMVRDLQRGASTGALRGAG